jgi:hypothetical protein
VLGSVAEDVGVGSVVVAKGFVELIKRKFSMPKSSFSSWDL